MQCISKLCVLVPLASLPAGPMAQAAEPTAAVRAREILAATGVTGGLDIMRALALGADFVMLGRAFHYAVGALGEKGPPHLIHILKDDMFLNMGQIGARTLAELKDHLVTRA